MTTQDILRPHPETAYAAELTALAAQDEHPRPTGWNLSPRAVVDYLLGTTLADGTVISPKYYGQRRIIEVAVASLVTDRALLLVGIPGTAKTWVSEHLAAAISGDSKLLVQGTAGMSEDALRYGWNYARLLAEGPSEAALVPSPVMVGMRTGKLVRLEELTRIPSDVQDALITVLSEKLLPIPELNREVQAVRGFNVIATANDRDKGVNELSSALRRRFNTVIMPLPATLEEEVEIVVNRAGAARPERGRSAPSSSSSTSPSRIARWSGASTNGNRERSPSPMFAIWRMTDARFVRRISGSVKSGRWSKFSSEYRRMQTPGPTRPHRPARWSADAFDTSSIGSR